MELKVLTEGVLPDTCEVVLEVREGATCGEVIKQLAEEYYQQGKGAWQLEEEWQGCRHRLSSDEPVPVEGVVNLHLRLLRSGQFIPEPVKRNHRRARRSKKLGQQFLRSPDAFLSTIPTCRQSSTVPTCRQLHCVSSCLQNRLDQQCRKYSATLLQRLGAGQALWGPQEPTLLDTLTAQLGALEQENLKFSTELSNLNIQSTRLQQQITPLSGRADKLSGELALLQEQVERRREERAKNAPKNVGQMKSELEKLHKELEMKNQLNTSLNSKLQKIKDHLTMQRKVLEDKKKEIEKLRGWVIEPHDNTKQNDDGQASAVSEPKVQSHSHSSRSNSHSSDVKSPSHSTTVEPRSHSTALATPPHTPSKRSTPSSSKKRHASIIEAKNRQLVAEEGQALRQQQTKQLSRNKKLEDKNRKGVWSRGGGAMRGGGLLSIPPPDSKWYEEEKEPSLDQLTSDKQAKTKRKKRVRFDAAAIVLNAALEGELELLKECIVKLGGCGYSNDKGATCLHNAVCSGNFEAVCFLVDQSCDINAQDIDGWTPLHCAVAYSNLLVIRYLVEHGASLFLNTRDGDTSLHIAQEEYKLLGVEPPNDGTTKAAVECLEYLREMENGLGQLNGGVVFALFSREQAEEGELSLAEGERLIVQDRGQGRKKESQKWWRVKNGQGQTGEVPSTFLGLYKNVKDVL